MALLRNMRNMHAAGVDPVTVGIALQGRARRSRALPFRFIAAARAVPQWEPMIDEAMQLAMQDMPKLTGRTALLVDVSGSMSAKLGGKSELNRLDAAEGAGDPAARRVRKRRCLHVRQHAETSFQHAPAWRSPTRLAAAVAARTSGRRCVR